MSDIKLSESTTVIDRSLIDEGGDVLVPHHATQEELRELGEELRIKSLEITAILQKYFGEASQWKVTIMARDPLDDTCSRHIVQTNDNPDVAAMTCLVKPRQKFSPEKTFLSEKA